MTTRNNRLNINFILKLKGSSDDNNKKDFLEVNTEITEPELKTEGKAKTAESLNNNTKNKEKQTVSKSSKTPVSKSKTKSPVLKTMNQTKGIY